jgi:hypothetical protein
MSLSIDQLRSAWRGDLKNSEEEKKEEKNLI